MKTFGGSLVLGAGLALAACSGGDDNPAPLISVPGQCGTTATSNVAVTIANTGRKLAPLGRMTTVGNFPTGGRLTPDGHFYWSVAAGHGENDVHIVNVATGAVTQVIPIAGTYGQMTFNADGTVAYVSGTPQGSSRPTWKDVTGADMVGKDGDVIHVFNVDLVSGHATERLGAPYPLALPAPSGASGKNDQFPPVTGAFPSGPVGLAVTPDGSTLVVAEYNDDRVALINTATGTSSTLAVGRYPYAVAFEHTGTYAYVTNAEDGTVSKIDVAGAMVAATISVVGNAPDSNNKNGQPQYVLADPVRDRVYVAVTNFDGVAIVNTTNDTLEKFVSLKRTEGYGSQPVALALARDGKTLYAANAGENAVAAIALTDRPLGAHAYDVIGKIPTADYTTDVQVTPDGCTLVWQTARGVATGPNVLYTSSHGYPAVNNDTDARVSPYPSYGMDMQIGAVGVTPLPTDAGFAQLTAVVDAAQSPDNLQARPADTPVTSTSGGASDKIKYVFYVVKENRTYDQLFGSDPRGNGDPALEVLEDNCGTTNPAFVRDRTHFGCGTTPNQHALSRQFVLLDNFYEDSEESFNGHAVTTGAYSTNYSLKTVAQLYSNRKRPDNQVGVFPVTFPPKYFLFDQAATQLITFRNYGELAGGSAPNFSNDGRLTYSQVIANSDTTNYPSNIFNGCYDNTNAPNSPVCAFDCGSVDGVAPSCNAAAPLSLSRINAFRNTFTQQVASCTALTAGTPACGVPQFNYMIFMSDHTNGVGDGARDPLAMVADNDLGVGQLLDILSHSAIWPYTTVFVVEDDSQDGADHVDAHRAPALVMGPYVKHGGQVVHTRYDQYSVVRTIELILGMEPLSVFDAVATPMYDVFTATPDNLPYVSIQPEFDLMAVCDATSHPCVTGDGSSTKVAAADLHQLAVANARLSAALPYNQMDRVPQAINDRLLWQRVFGLSRPVPPPGPNASRLEHARAVEAMRLWERYSFFAPLARQRLYAFLAEADDD